ncbi:hypothetical protein [Dyadobacter sp. NIV53]|uniref:hypothetical protein n=1 Tax=Dyadobacter sp. NIV53 TaxID=2861765 RepID=UPI001C87FC7B|nr:hypothetical protein [Dyadobacter sp. NIV53]
MKTLLKHKSSRSIFLISIGLILLVILIIRFFVLPNFEPIVPDSGIIPRDPKWLTIVSRIFDSAFVSLTVTVCIGLFLFHIELPDEEKKFEIIESFKINELFEKERNQTEIWYFTGGLGRYTRTSTIPEIAKIAQRTNEHKSIKIQIIDPTDESICIKYANFRRGLNSASKNNSIWNKEYVRHECTATVVSAIIYKCNYPLLDLSICLKNNFSTLRIDLSSKTAIITKEDPKEPALICREGSFLYRTYKEEILQTFKEYKPINTSINFPYQLQTLTTENVHDIINQLNLDSGLTVNDYEKITEILRSTEKPYA